ncbi:50S ribosomal protein L24 [uncultured archaeon]|nr:50S ribosomal protein L24 [uncultured archaeon]
MKSEFNTSWRESKQPRKQRKYLHNLPNHLRQKQMSATLDKDLRKKYGLRSLEVRKGDEVVVMRGKFKKKVGKVTEVNVKENVVAVENVQNTKKDGSKINAWFHPSKLKIKSIVDDKFRLPTKKTEVKSEEKKK